MAEEKMTLTFDAKNMMVLHQILAGQASMTKHAAATRKQTTGIASDFAKIPRRLVIAGGAAIAFSMTVGQIRAGWQAYNALLDQSKEKLASMVDHAKNLLSMLPIERAKQLFPGLPRAVAEKRLPAKEIMTIQETVLSLMPPEAGYSEAVRAEARRAAEDIVRARGMPAEGIAIALTKAHTLMPKATPRQWGNMLNVFLTQAGFTGEQLKEVPTQLPKAYQAGAMWQIPPEEMLALMTLGTRVAGTPARAMKGMEMMIAEAKTRPGLRRRLGLSKAEAEEMGVYEMLSHVSAAELTPTEAYEYFGRRGAPRTYGILARWPEVEKMREEYLAAKEAPGWIAGEQYAAKRAGVPLIAMRERQMVAEELSALKKLQPGYVRAATTRTELGTMLEQVTKPTVYGWAARKIWTGRYYTLQALGLSPEAAAADVVSRAEQRLDPWGVVLRPAEDVLAPPGGVYERHRRQLGLTYEGQVAPLDTGARPISVSTEPLEGED